MGRRGRPRYPDVLTPREQDVLSLVREGLTNEQIAARLNISFETVKHHVSEILSKLGVATREEAAVWGEEDVGRPLSLKSAILGMAGATVIVVAAVGIGVVAWGVVEGGGADRYATQIDTNLTAAEIEALHELAREWGEGGNFTPAVPLYIPAELEHLPCDPECSGGSAPSGATLRFVASDLRPEGPPVALTADISQGFASGSPGVTGTFPVIDLDGIPAAAQIGESGAGSGFYVLGFTVGNIEFLLSVDWRTPDGRITDSMKQETERMALSLIADARRQGIVHS